MAQPPLIQVAPVGWRAPATRTQQGITYHTPRNAMQAGRLAPQATTPLAPNKPTNQQASKLRGEDRTGE